MFSPYYAWSGWSDPLDHCSVNIALYGTSHSRWAMTERGRDSVDRSADFLRIGPSSLFWRSDSLVIDVAERSAPWSRRIAGTIRVTPEILPGKRFPLDDEGRHVWQPVAPRARIEIDLRHPALRWSGEAYLDSNFGVEPLESRFSGWSWSRARHGDGCVVLYDANRRDGAETSLALRFAADGSTHLQPVLPPSALPVTGWRLLRSTRADEGAPVLVRRTLEDTPFYARSLLSATVYGRPVLAFHESLSLDRFRSRLVRALLPFRMPRASEPRRGRTRE